MNFDDSSNYNNKKDFTSLAAWRDSRKVKLYFYQQIIPVIPYDEKYNLNSQIRRCAVSITANIAEGHGRYHYKEAIQFYRISRGSLSELKDHLITCSDLGIIDKDLYKAGSKLIEKAKISINGFIKYNQGKIK